MITRSVISVGILILLITSSASVQVDLKELEQGLYLDVTYLPEKFDEDRLIRIYHFLAETVIADIRTPYPDGLGQYPLVVRYIPYTEEGDFPVSTAGYAGWCDVVTMTCSEENSASCRIDSRQTQDTANRVFLALIATFDVVEPDYEVELWGFTTHEISHYFGAIDGPRCPLYKFDKLVAPVHPESDTYYWFGIANLFDGHYKGIVWDAWHDTCSDDVCENYREAIFNSD